MTGYYIGKTATLNVSVLGSNYDVYLDVNPEDDPILKDCDGYTDKTVRRIVVVDKAKDSDLEDWTAYRKKVLRHEIIHAFLIESGISSCVKWDVQGEEHPEAMVDWIAVQFEKIHKAFVMAGAL